MPDAPFHYATPTGERRGPVDAGTLKDLIKAGIVTRDTLVWHEGMVEWAPAATVSGLFAEPPPIPPRPQAQREPPQLPANAPPRAVPPPPVAESPATLRQLPSSVQGAPYRSRSTTEADATPRPGSATFAAIAAMALGPILLFIAVTDAIASPKAPDLPDGVVVLFLILLPIGFVIWIAQTVGGIGVLMNRAWSRPVLLWACATDIGLVLLEALLLSAATRRFSDGDRLGLLLTLGVNVKIIHTLFRADVKEWYASIRRT